MPLLNYTTEIPAEKTVNEIQKILVRGGATAILSDFKNGVLVAVSFKVQTRFGLTAYSLPCDIPAVLALLKRQKVSPRYQTEDHAARVGWRIIKDWIEAQLALVQTEMVTLDQVFLPYVQTNDGRTLYQRFVAGDAGPLLLTSSQ